MTFVPTQPEALVLEALLDRVKVIDFLPVEWPNEPFSVPNDRKYVRVALRPNQTARFLIDSDGPHRHFGILQLTVVWPRDQGEREAREMAGRVASLFPADYKMKIGDVIVRSVKRPSVASSMPDGADLLTPVSVEYESYI